MRRAVYLCAVVFALVLVALILHGIPLAVLAGPQPAAGRNGDLNADGEVDVADAVYLLFHLFRGGPEPAACAAAPELVERISELESELLRTTNALAQSVARVQSLQDELASRERDLSDSAARIQELESQLAAAEAATATCQGDLLASTATANELEAALAECRDRSCPGSNKGLPDTGQSSCTSFVENQGWWVAVTCAEASCAGQDGSYASGCPSAARFVDNGDGTVSDTCAGLMWQQITADVNGDGQLSIQDRTPWCNAIAYCEGLSFAGHDDWRLPNVRELQSIVDYSRNGPATDPRFGAFSSWYWSSTSSATGPANAWNVTFDEGVVRLEEKLTGYYVRAVRSGL